MLIVIAVIGILASAIITVLNPISQLQKGRDARRKSDLAQIQKALELYYNDNETYPASLTFGASWLPYMPMVPQDPRTGRNYSYIPSGQSYEMYASLERGANDPQSCAPTGGNNGAPCPGGGACGLPCNYRVTSSNI